LLFSFLLPAGCADFFPYPLPPVSPPPPASPSPIVLPPPAARAYTFGVAFSPGESFHPLTGTLRHNVHAARLCYEGLVELDNGFTPQLLLASSIETSDNANFTVRLHEGVTFHDGSPLTAADVVYSFGQARRAGGPYTGRLAAITSVTAQDDLTVLITAPVFNAAALFDFPIIRESAAAIPPGTGPYFARFIDGEGFLLPYEDWWQGKPHPAPRIELVEISDAGVLVWSFQYGYVSMMPYDPWDTLSPGIHAGFDKIAVPGALMQYIGFNTRRRPFSQAANRQAAALAIRREEAVKQVYGEDAVAAVLPVPPSSPFYMNVLPEPGLFSPDEAYLPGAGVSLDFIVNADNAARLKLAELLAEDLRRAGFEVRFRPVGQAVFTAALEAGDFDIYYAEARLSPNLDPAAFLAPGGSFNFGGYDSAAMTGALNRLAADDLDTLAEVWSVLHDELPILTICFRNTFLISQRGKLSGQTPTFFNPFAGFGDWAVSDER
jgi:peptide/nickel transport system substrate-binding protein